MSARWMNGLNEPQRTAVLTIEGPLLVLAGAGTGKTRVVTARMAHMIDSGIPSSRILAVTFTNKAAREMRERVEKLVPASSAKDLTVTTFHSLAVRLLRRFGEVIGLRKNFTIADDDDVTTLLRSALRELGVAQSTLSLKAAGALIDGWKNRGLSAEAALEEACDDKEILAANAYGRLVKEMSHRQVIDFDDMILLTLRLFDQHADVLEQCRDRFRYMMVDEYQDTNESQYRIVRALSGTRRNLCVVGDDDQSIYGWRGARSGNILDFSKHYPGAKVVTLEQNYRSTNVILKAANCVITNNPNRREKRLWSALGDGETITLYKAEDEKDEIRWTVSRIAERINASVAHEDLAVLFRANTQSNALELVLRERKIPYRIVGTNSLFDRREIRDVLAYLRVVCNPSDDSALMRVINLPPRGIGKALQSRLLEHAVDRRAGTYEIIRSGAAESLEPKHAEALAAFRTQLAAFESDAREDLRGALERLIDGIGYKAYLGIEYPDALDAQLRCNMVDELIRAAESFQRRHPEGGLHGFLESLALDRDQRDDDVSKKRGITLMTVHSAKGLEFEEVWLVGVEEGIFPHKRSFGDDEVLDTIDEERRLFYVAVTRARRRLSMSWSARRARWGRIDPCSVSRFVLEIDDDLKTEIDPSTQGPADSTSAENYFSQLWTKMGGAPTSTNDRPRFGGRGREAGR